MSNESTTTKSIEQSGNNSSKADPWRYRCPNRHSSWTGFATSNEYLCKTCGVRFTEEDLLDLREEDTNS
jgi:transposase-like protein